MVDLKGVYSFEVRDKDTKELLDSGEINNVVTDDFLWMYYPDGWNYAKINLPNAKIILSDTGGSIVDTGGEDIRRLHLADPLLPKTNVSGDRGVSVKTEDSSWEFSNNFGPLPEGTSHTYDYISVSMKPGGYDMQGRRVSLVRLSTPITHDDKTYLYIKYKLYITPNFRSGYNASGNSFINNTMKNDFVRMGFYITMPMDGEHRYVEPSRDSNFSYAFKNGYRGMTPRLTTSLPARNIDNIGRYIDIKRYLSNRINPRRGWEQNTTRHGFWFGRYDSQPYRTGDITGTIGTIVFGGRLGDNPHNDRYWYTVFGQAPMKTGKYFSRVFTHSADSTAIFSDPSKPAESRGVLTLGGDMDAHATYDLKVVFSKTGIATDDDTDPNQATFYLSGGIEQGGDRSAGWNVRSIHKNKLREPADSDLFDTFDGIYQNVKFRCTDPNDRTNEFSIFQNKWDEDVCLCTRYTHSVESAVCVDSFSTNGGAILYSGAAVGVGAYSNIIYIASSDGLRTFDMVTKTITDHTDKISVDLTDITLDAANGELWVGLQNGVAKIDQDDFTMTSYTFDNTMAISEALVDADHAAVRSGQLSIYDGVILRGGGDMHAAHSDGYNSGYFKSDHSTSAWVFDSNDGTCQLIETTRDIMGVYIRTKDEFYVYKRYNHPSSYSNTTGNFEEYRREDGVWSKQATYNDGLNVLSGGHYFNVVTQLVPNGLNEEICIVAHANRTDWRYTDTRHIALNMGTKEVHVYTRYIRDEYYDYALNDYRKTNQTWGRSDLRQSYCQGPYYHSPESKERRALFNSSRTLYMMDGRAPYICSGADLYRDPSVPLGWDGTQWKYMRTPTTHPVKDSPIQLWDGVTLNFDNAAGVEWDHQFVAGENMTFSYGQMPIKDNLQKYSLEFKYYTVHAQREETIITVPQPVDPSIGYIEVELTDITSKPGFREIDPDGGLIKTGDLKATKMSDGSELTFSLGTDSGWVLTNSKIREAVDTGSLKIGDLDIPTGTILRFAGNSNDNAGGMSPTSNESYLLGPLRYWSNDDLRIGFKYAVNIGDGKIKIANSLDAALSGDALDFNTSGRERVDFAYRDGYNEYQPIIRYFTPEDNTVYLTYRGKAIFPASMAGEQIKIECLATYY